MVATASSDATVRIYKNRKLKNKQEFFHKFTIKQREENVEEKEGEIKNQQKIDIEGDVEMQDENNKENLNVPNSENSQIKEKSERPSLQASSAPELKRKSHRLFLDDTEY